jgi:hypothetical protein
MRMNNTCLLHGFVEENEGRTPLLSFTFPAEFAVIAGESPRRANARRWLEGRIERLIISVNNKARVIMSTTTPLGLGGT